MIHPFYAPVTIQEGYVNGEAHPKSVDGLAGFDPQALTGLQLRMLQQTNPPAARSVRNAHVFRHHGSASPVPNHETTLGVAGPLGRSGLRQHTLEVKHSNGGKSFWNLAVSYT